MTVKKLISLLESAQASGCGDYEVNIQTGYTLTIDIKNAFSRREQGKVFLIGEEAKGFITEG